MYIKNDNGNIVLWDVDDTLVFFEPLNRVEPIQITISSYTEIVYPNYPEIDNLKRAAFRGHFVRVHSQGGQDWAEAVVQALNLENYVSSIECKPKWYHDDLPADAWMHRFYKKAE
jgi:predicted phosphatase